MTLSLVAHSSHDRSLSRVSFVDLFFYTTVLEGFCLPTGPGTDASPSKGAVW